MRNLYIGIVFGDNIAECTPIYDNDAFSLSSFEGLNAVQTSAATNQPSGGGSAHVVEGISLPSTISFSVRLPNAAGLAVGMAGFMTFGVVMEADDGTILYKAPLVATSVDVSTEDDGLNINVSAISPNCGAWRVGRMQGNVCTPVQMSMNVPRAGRVDVAPCPSERGLLIRGTGTANEQLYKSVAVQYTDANGVSRENVYGVNAAIPQDRRWEFEVKSDGTVRFSKQDTSGGALIEHDELIDWTKRIALLPRTYCAIVNRCEEAVTVLCDDWRISV